MQSSVHSGAHDFIRSFESFYQTDLFKKYENHEHDPSRISLAQSFRIDRKKRDNEIPFMIRVLSNRLHMGAMINGKPLYPSEKPAIEKNRINIDIPEYKASEVYEPRDHRTISGGQWQRIALARSFMKIKEADLLILDEPSSALDPQAEYEVFKTIMELRRNKTTIYIVFPTLSAGLIQSRIAFIQFVLHQRSWCFLF